MWAYIQSLHSLSYNVWQWPSSKITPDSQFLEGRTPCPLPYGVPLGKAAKRTSTGTQELPFVLWHWEKQFSHPWVPFQLPVTLSEAGTNQNNQFPLIFPSVHSIRDSLSPALFDNHNMTMDSWQLAFGAGNGLVAVQTAQKGREDTWSWGLYMDNAHVMDEAMVNTSGLFTMHTHWI